MRKLISVFIAALIFPQTEPVQVTGNRRNSPIKALPL